MDGMPLLKLMLDQPHGIVYVALLVVIILLFRSMNKKDAYLLTVSTAVSGLKDEMSANRETQMKSITLLEMLVYGKHTKPDLP